MDEDKGLELRMYGLVPYNISPIQQAIQYGHAVVEYSNHIMQKNFDTETEIQYINWALNWKTFIILNGGTTNSRESAERIPFGSLNQHIETLTKMEIPRATFREPDLQDAYTAVVFIVDEKVFKKRPYTDDPEEKYYPDFFDYLEEKTGFIQVEGTYRDLKDQFPSHHKNWVELIGGERNLFLRNFLKPFKLA